MVCICLNLSTKHAIRAGYSQNTCLILVNTDWYVSIHTRHVSIHTHNTYRNTYQNTYQYGAVVLVCIQYIPVRIDMYSVCIDICIQYVLNHFQHDTFEYLIQYIPNTKVCIGMYYGMYVYVSGSVSCLYHTVFDIFYDDKYQYM